jgi:hypothetical protein
MAGGNIHPKAVGAGRDNLRESLRGRACECVLRNNVNIYSFSLITKV